MVAGVKCLFCLVGLCIATATDTSQSRSPSTRSVKPSLKRRFTGQSKHQFSPPPVQPPAFNDSMDGILTIAHFRHGLRAPNKLPYPQNPFTPANVWKEGWGELTKEGKRQCHIIGRAFRLRYDGFIAENFNRHEVYVRTTAMYRTKETALMLLSGLYMPRDKDSRVHESLNWVPVPTNDLGENKPDPLLKPADYHCPKYSKLKNAAEVEMEKEMSREFHNVFKYLRDHISPNHGTLKQLRKLNDVYRQIQMKLPVEEWITRTIWDKREDGVYCRRESPSTSGWLKSTLDLAREVHFRWRNNTLKGEMAVLMGGFLLADYISRAIEQVQKYENCKHPKPSNQSTEKMRKSSSDKKMVIYVSHDITIMALLNLLGLRGHQPVPQGSSLVMDVFAYKERPYVRFLFHENDKFTTLQLPFCENRDECDFNIFVRKNIHKAIWSQEELDERCALNDREISAEENIQSGAA